MTGKGRRSKSFAVPSRRKRSGQAGIPLISRKCIATRVRTLPSGDWERRVSAHARARVRACTRRKGRAIRPSGPIHPPSIHPLSLVRFFVCSPAPSLGLILLNQVSAQGTKSKSPSVRLLPLRLLGPDFW